jgi:hypothetical protein
MEREVILLLHIAFLAEDLAVVSRKAVSVVDGSGSESNLLAIH